MRDLFLFDYSFNLLAVYPKHVSVNISPNYNSFGSFEAHFSINTNGLLKNLKDNKYLLFRYKGVYYPVTGYMVDEDIAVYGRTLEWLLTKRTIDKQSFEGEIPENIARSIVAEGAGDFITLGTYKGLGVPQDYKTEKPMTVYDALTNLLSPLDLGFALTVNASKKFEFSVYKGEDLTLILSKSNKTAYKMTYTADRQNMVTECGWYEQIIEDMGDWNPSTNTPSLSDVQTDNAYKCYKISEATAFRFELECKEGSYLYSDTADGKWKISEDRPTSVWVYIDNENLSGPQKWETVIDRYNKKSEAETKLKSLIDTETVDTETRRVEYLENYSIGDTVRVQYEYGDFLSTVRKRIIGVDIYSDENSEGVRPRLENVKGD